MNGAIRNIVSLERWFNDVGSPFFTLTYAGSGQNQVIMRNTAFEEMSDAWDLLRSQVLAQSEYGRATMQVIVYKKEKGANNPDGRTNIDMQPTSVPSAQFAGIGSLPAGLDENKVAGMIDKARQEDRAKWEMERRLEDLEAQLNAPNDDWTEKLMTGIERIGSTPLGAILIQKLLGGAPMPMPHTASPINGVPAPADDADDTFEEDIEKTAALLGVDDVTLARKMRKLAEANPELAKQILQQ